MFETLNALVLREVRYKEADRILTLLTDKEGKLTATSKVVHRGKTSCLIEVEIRDDADKLVYQGSCTYFCITPEGGQDPALKK